MAKATNDDVTFIVSGQKEDAAAPIAGRGTVRGSVRVGTLRSGGAPVRLKARPGEDVVVLTVGNGPTLVLHPHDARDLIRAQLAGGQPLRGGASKPVGNEVEVPAQLGWPGSASGATRGLLGQALLTGVQVLTGVGKDPAAKLVAAAVTRKVDGAVDPGVYQLAPGALDSLKGSASKLATVPAAGAGAPSLVLVHGTFSDTARTFGKLWQEHPDVVRRLFAHYGERVYGLEHATLGTSPIANALALARALPAKATVHLLSHSRGGLVAEALARAAAGGTGAKKTLAGFAGAGYAQQRDDLAALFAEARAKQLRVERVVRVACPSRGTLLASKRLDAYLSIVSWSLELAGIPVAPALVDFLHEVARRRADPSELPGLEAMLPGSPTVEWLNGADAPIPGELRVIAGDLSGDSVGSWVKTLLADAFYWTDNDLIVQTRSMYGGAPRGVGDAAPGVAARPAARFLLDRGGKVSHFAYFSNARTVKAIADALLEAEPAGFAAIGPLSWAGMDASGTRARQQPRSRARERADGASAAARPAVFVLPGILGSHLALDGKRLWLAPSFVNSLKRLAWDAPAAGRVKPDGPIESVYGALIERLRDSHEVIPFGFDWRRPIEDEAERLAGAVEAEMAARATSGAPVRIVAHSMGGLVARSMAFVRKGAVWKAWMAREGTRLLMLGTPNGGSWSPMQTLSGDDTFGNALAAFGSLFDNRGARDTMAGMPGFLQLQAALLDRTLRLDRAETWQKLADDDIAVLRERASWHSEGPQQTIYQWGAPPQEVLDQAVALREKLDAQAASLGSDADKLSLVVGRAPFTPAGYAMAGDGLEYLDAAGGGDGRVTLECAMLPNVGTWQVDASHGDLPGAKDAFDGYLELLAGGTTERLQPVLPSGAGAGSGRKTALVRSRPSHGLTSSLPPSSPSDVLARTALPTDSEPNPGTALHVTVVNGDLKFVHEPLVVGHYRSIALSGTEEVVDGLVVGAMTKSLAVGNYPEAPGEHQIFGNVRRDPENVLAMARPIAVVVAGLGEEGKLRALDIAATFRLAAIAYSQRLLEQPDQVPAEFELASTLIGSGGAGISPAIAAQAIAQGAWEANQKLAQNGWPQIGRLMLIELHLDRASDAWRALRVQATAAPQRLVVAETVRSAAGALRRTVDSNYRGAAYDFISATGATGDRGEPVIVYSLDTKRARTEVRAQHAQGALVTSLIAKASNDANRDVQIGRTLFDLLVPIEMEPFLGGTSEMVIELDSVTAAIPWELLDTRRIEAVGDDPRPWALRSKLLRKLRVKEFRAQPSDAQSDGSVFVVGDPSSDNPAYLPLPGAREEAIAVATLLSDSRFGVEAANVQALTSGRDEARTIINGLFERPYRIVHIAGHGEPSGAGGVVLSGGAFLGPTEIRAMRIVPELVFLNCCHLAAMGPEKGRDPYNRAAFAASTAEALIKIGVRCVVAAGWAVEDQPAKTFATCFYDALLKGRRFIDAVAAARTAAWQDGENGNTWAAYQCYGDPNWTWRRDPARIERDPIPLADEYAGVSSPPELTLALETIALKIRFGGDSARKGKSLEKQRDRLHWLDAKFGSLWGGMGAVAEAFGVAYTDASQADKAIAWYRRAVDAEDGSASFKSAEQLGNQLARRGEKNKTDPVRARQDIEEAIARLERLIELRPTAERESLLGSAYKRLVMLEAAAAEAKAGKGRGGRGKRRAGQVTTGDAERLSALGQMALHYRKAAQLAKERADSDFYPAKNGISAELRLSFLEGRPADRLAERMAAVKDSIDRAARRQPDFWNVVGQTELRLLESIVAGKLADNSPEIIRELSELKARVHSPHLWDSVYNESRFTLEPYRKVAGSAEQKAVTALLESLAAMAKSD